MDAGRRSGENCPWGGPRRQLGLSFTGPVRVSIKTRAPRGVPSSSAAAYSWGTDSGIDIGGIFDGFDFGCGD
jgi:hypothetical protein